MRAILLCVLLVLPLSAPAQPAMIARLEAALKQRPEDPTLWFWLARAYADAPDIKASVAALEKVVTLGEGFLPPADFGFEKVWDDAGFKTVRAKLEAKLPRLDFAPTAFELEDRTFIPEGIAYDPGTATFLVGSIPQRRIVRVAPGGKVTDFAGPEAKLDHVLGLAFDAPRRILYAVSSTALTEAGEKDRRNSVTAFDGDNGKVIRRIEFPEALNLNDVAVARGGRVFASDSGAGTIYEIPRMGPPRIVVPAGQLPGSNGLAVSPDVRLLYVAHSTGVAAVDLASGKVTSRLALPPRENVSAIDGLYEWQGQLVGVQNATTPGRVIVMTLSPDGLSVTRLQTLLSHHHPSLFEPTTGTVTSHGFYLLAATAVARFNREGKIDRPESLPRPTVLRIPLTR